MGFKVLIVEDSRATRELLAAAVESIDGAEVVESASGYDALRHVARDTFDLILTDINMPDINGLELIAYVKRNPRTRDVPLFVVSSEGSEQDRRRGLELGATEYLVKPFEPDALCALVRRHVRGP